jgi:predicted phosphate transport protein (TIGR00153 family)
MIRLLHGLFPYQHDFFALFEENTRTVVEAGQVLVQALEHSETLAAQATRLTELEHSADDVTHQVMAALHRTFLPPLDRSDIGALASALDDVVDGMEAVLTRARLYKLHAPSPLAQELARLALRQAELINQAMLLLRHRDQRGGIQGHLIEVNRLENAADGLLDDALSTVYDTAAGLPGLIERLKWREVYELLEAVTDSGEDVASILEGIVSRDA